MKAVALVFLALLVPAAARAHRVCNGETTYVHVATEEMQANVLWEFVGYDTSLAGRLEPVYRKRVRPSPRTATRLRQRTNKRSLTPSYVSR